MFNASVRLKHTNDSDHRLLDKGTFVTFQPEVSNKLTTWEFGTHLPTLHQFQCCLAEIALQWIITPAGFGFQHRNWFNTLPVPIADAESPLRCRYLASWQQEWTPNPCIDTRSALGVNFILLECDCLTFTLFKAADLWREGYLTRFPPGTGKTMPTMHLLHRKQVCLGDQRVVYTQHACAQPLQEGQSPWQLRHSQSIRRTSWVAPTSKTQLLKQVEQSRNMSRHQVSLRLQIDSLFCTTLPLTVQKQDETPLRLISWLNYKLDSELEIFVENAMQYLSTREHDDNQVLLQLGAKHVRQGGQARTEVELRDRLIDLVSVGNLRHRPEALFSLFWKFLQRIFLPRLVHFFDLVLSCLCKLPGPVRRKHSWVVTTSGTCTRQPLWTPSLGWRYLMSSLRMTTSTMCGSSGMGTRSCCSRIQDGGAWLHHEI